MECGDCTLCCDLLPVKWLQKPVNTPCKFCDKGCTIHDTKDKECKEFNCMWVQRTKGFLTEEAYDEYMSIRPDKSHVIFEKHSDSHIVATLDARFKITSIAERQIKSFGKQGYTIRLGASDFRKPIIWQLTEQI